MRSRIHRPLIQFALLNLLLVFNNVAVGAENLKVGIYQNAPKVFFNSDGRATGILVDVLNKIAETEKWTLEYIPCEWEKCLVALQTGEIDLLPDVAYSEERNVTFDFHQTPALHSWSQIYRHPSVSVTSMLDLKGMRVAMLRGSIQEDFFAEVSTNFGLNAVLIPTASIKSAFQLVEQGKADVVIANKHFGDVEASRYHLLDTPIVFQPARLFFAAGNGRQQHVLAAIDRHLNAWQKDPHSVYFDILRNWQAHSPSSRIPIAFWWGLGAVIFLLFSVFCAAIFLRRQVASKTRDLLDSERKLSTILDSVESLIYIKDTKYRYQYVNRAVCQLLGKSTDDIIGKGDRQLFDKSTADALFENDRRVIERGERVVVEEARASAASIAPVTFLSTQLPLCRDDGTVYALCGISTDISERKQAEDALRIAATVFQSQEGMFVSGPNKLVLKVNNAFTAMTGYRIDDIVDRELPEVSLEQNGSDGMSAVWRIVERDGKWQGEVWARRKDGEEYPAWLTVTVVRDANEDTTHYVGTQIDITQHKLAQNQITRLAYYDPLTGLPNRRLLLDKLQQYLSVRRPGEKAGALLFIDLDNFKDLNDTRGHKVGDQLLQQVAQRIVDCSRGSGTVARLGGDEFVILLEDAGSSEEEVAANTAAIGRKILGVVGQSYMIAGTAHHATCSIGATLCTDPEVEINDLMKRGDLAMYQAKREGRNTLCFFNSEMESALTIRTGLEMEIREAIQKSQFRLHYQPQVDSRGYMTGAEALLRWQHPERGILTPETVIPIAEASGLILPLGHWVLLTACTQLASWAASPETAHLTLAVNVSARQFRQPDFVSQTLDILEETGADPFKLKLELTESMLIENIEDTIAKMKLLKNRGVGFSLDDFGTGYSSLFYLKRLPLDQLKIDRSFVRDVLTDPNDATIARSIVALAKSLGLGIIAEGVETEAQRNFLATIGCDAYQGYLFGRPMEIEMLQQLSVAESALR